MFTIIIIVLLLIENRKWTLDEIDIKYALSFILIDVIDFIIAYFIFT
jgi:hypothetical protein